MSSSHGQQLEAGAVTGAELANINQLLLVFDYENLNL